MTRPDPFQLVVVAASSLVFLALVVVIASHLLALPIAPEPGDPMYPAQQSTIDALEAIISLPGAIVFTALAAILTYLWAMRGGGR